jgi:hypothetical protein
MNERVQREFWGDVLRSVDIDYELYFKMLTLQIIPLALSR